MPEQYVVVTGASKGIGRATALHLDKHGFHVFAGVRSTADGEDLKKEASTRLIPLLIDVTNLAQIEAAARQVLIVVGTTGLAGLVNNAGVSFAAPLEYIPIDTLRQQLEINVIGQVAVTQAFLECIRQARGRIINISSIGGRIVTPFNGPYNASKFALESICDSLRVELKPWGIEVISIEPGVVTTPIWETALAVADEMAARMPLRYHELYDGTVAKARQVMVDRVKKGIPPERVAEVIAKVLTAARPKTRYLVGPDAQFAGWFITKLPDRIKDRLIS